MISINRIIMLDDDTIMHQFVLDILTELDEFECELIAHHDFDVALDLLRTQEFDLCLVDYMFHDRKQRNGIDFIEEAINIDPYLPCILFTGSGNHITALQGIQVGAVDYIDKGNVSPRTFLRSVRYALKRSSTLKELYSLYQQTNLVSQYREEMMRLASHDIKNPLATIIMSADILKLKPDITKDDITRHMQRIESAAWRIKSITEDILSVEKLGLNEDFESSDINHPNSKRDQGVNTSR